MADLEELGPPPAFGAIVRAGDAVARLHLSTDITVPDYTARIAARVEKAVVEAQEAIDYAVELHHEGALQPVELVPSADAASETARRDAPRVWACHAELQDALEFLVAGGPDVYLSLERAEDYETALRGAKQALDAIERQREEALHTGGPRRPDPSETPPAGSAHRGTDADAAPEEEPPLRTGPSRDGGDDAARFTHVLTALGTSESAEPHPFEDAAEMPPVASPADVIHRFLQATQSAEQAADDDSGVHPSAEKTAEEQRRYIEEAEGHSREHQRDQSQGLGY
jgi:hypothetical protein